MNLHIIACQVFYREISYLASMSPHITWVTWLPQGMHNTPGLLRDAIQTEISRVDLLAEQGAMLRQPDYLVLGYGLCSNGTAGLSSRRFPIAAPRTDDCIGLFLGSQQRYLDEFNKYPGTYWLTSGWLESAYVPTAANLSKTLERYTALYGEENAGYLFREEHSWMSRYTDCRYITSQVYDRPDYTETARDAAACNGWTFRTLPGDLSLLSRMLHGIFREDEVLVCPPGRTIQPSYDRQKICFV